MPADSSALTPGADCDEVLRVEPIASLAAQVLAGELTLAAAERHAQELGPIDADLIDRYDDCINELAQQDLKRATILAALICRLAYQHANHKPWLWGNCNNTLGWLCRKQDELERALECYRQAMAVFIDLPHAQKTVAMIRLEIGQIYERQGDISEARDEYQAVLEMKLDDPSITAIALGDRGRVADFLGRLEEAAEDHSSALKISRSINDREATGRHLNDLGNVLAALGRLDEAEQYLKDALAIARQKHDRDAEQSPLGNLGNLYHTKADRTPDRRAHWLELAWQYHEQALTIASELKHPVREGRHQANLGNIATELGKLQAAAGDVSRASEHFDEAERRYERARALALEHKAIDSEWRVQFAWGDLCVARGQPQPAFTHYTEAIRIVEEQREQVKDIHLRTKLWQEKALLYRQMMLCCLHLGKLWEALEYTERARTRYVADVLANAPKGVADYAPTSDTRAIIQAAIDNLSPRAAVVVFNVTETGVAVFVVTKSSDVESDGWRSSADPRIYAKVVEGFNRTTLRKLLIGFDADGKASGYLGDYYTAPILWREVTLKATMDAIYQAVLDEVEQLLTRLAVKRIILMPNLGLSLLPLHACGSPQALLDRFEISYVPSFELLRHCQRLASRTANADANLLAVANPDHSLYWAGVEVDQIAKLFTQAQVLGDRQDHPATPGAVVGVIQDAALLHFACHGMFDPIDPLRSHLRLAASRVDTTDDSSALLTLDQILRDMKVSRARLAIMSACETGMIDSSDLADEYIGLPAGFLLAGTPLVIASLWRAHSLSTFLLMQRFYHYFIVEGLRPAAALRQAQIWLRDLTFAEWARHNTSILAGNWIACILMEQARRRLLEQHCKRENGAENEKPFAAPYYWAAFTIIGVIDSSEAAITVPDGTAR